MKDREIRRLPAQLEVRKDAADFTVRGHIPYMTLSEDIGGFREQLAPTAFARTLDHGADVKFLWAHRDDEVLGSTRAGTLRLENRADGLFFECELPKTAADRWETLKRGDVNGLSFGFIPEASDWDSTGEIPVRTIRAARLLELSAVAWPAYPASSITARQQRSSKSEGEDRSALSLRLRIIKESYDE